MFPINFSCPMYFSSSQMVSNTSGWIFFFFLHFFLLFSFFFFFSFSKWKIFVFHCNNAFKGHFNASLIASLKLKKWKCGNMYLNIQKYSLAFSLKVHLGGIEDIFHFVPLWIGLWCPKWLRMSQRHPCLRKHTQNCPTSYLF